jgi:glutamyl-tRNA synthetase
VRKHVTPDILPLVDLLREELEELADWSAPAIHRLINDLATAKQIPLGKLAQPLRLAVCGGTVSPPIDATLGILGKAESLTRLEAAGERWASQALPPS